MRFAPTTSQPPPRLSSPHQPDLPENQYSYRPPPQTPSEPSHPGAPPTFHATHPLLPFSSADSHSGFAASELDFHSPSLSLPLRDPLPPRRSGQPSRHTLRLRVSLSATLTPRPAFSPPSILLIPFRFILIHRLFLSLSPSLFCFSFHSIGIPLRRRTKASLSLLLTASTPSPPPRCPPTCHEARSLSLSHRHRRCRLGQPPLYWLNDCLKRPDIQPGTYKDETRV